MPTCAIISFRLGFTDGVSIVAGHWQTLLTELGFDVVTVAGEGEVDRTVAGLAIGAPQPPPLSEVSDALADADLVVVENLASIPLNLPASSIVAEVLDGRPAVLHHHDPPWQRERFRHITALPPLDPAWTHVTVNDLTRREFGERGIPATTIYNAFDTEADPGNRSGTRASLGISDNELLVAHPVRAIARKNVPEALAITEELGGTYWLLGQAEEGYGPTLECLLAAAQCPVIQRRVRTIADIYAAADVVVFPSTWEGFGNPPIEAAIHGKPVVVGDYLVGSEIEALGFDWFHRQDLEKVRAEIAAPNLDRIRRNSDTAAGNFSFNQIRSQLAALLTSRGWLP